MLRRKVPIRTLVFERAASRRKGFSSYKIFRLCLGMDACKGCRSWVHLIARLVHDHGHEPDLEELYEMRSLKQIHLDPVCFPMC